MDGPSGRWSETGARILDWVDAHRPLTAGLFAGGVFGLFFYYLYLQAVVGEFRADFVVEQLPTFLFGLQLTMLLTAGSFAVGIGLGFLTATARVSESKAWQRIAKGYVDVFRGTPILVQIFLWFTVILAVMPTYQYRALVAAFLALTINTGAYQGEIFRGGLKAIQLGQIEAGRAIGFTPWQLTRHIKLPQTLRLIIPPMTNEFILLLKASALLTAIGIVELTFVARQCTVVYFLPQECWIAATLLYLAVTIPLAKLVQVLEKRLRIPGLGLPVAGGVTRRVRPVAPGRTPGPSTLRGLGRRENGLYALLRRHAVRWRGATPGPEKGLTPPAVAPKGGPALAGPYR